MNAQRIIFPEPGRLFVEEFELEDPAPHEVQVANAVNGICMFDVSLYRGIQPLSFFPGGRVGHEGIGRVVKVGSEVKGIAEGDWVPSVSFATHENLSAAKLRSFVRPPVKPEYWLTEPAACIVIATTAYDIVPGDRVLVLGAGYMGLLNVQMLARSPLGELVVADVKAENLEIAKTLGATETVLIEGDGVESLKKFEDKPFDLVVEVAGVQGTLDNATRMTRTGGRLAVFAWHHNDRNIDMDTWCQKGIRVLNCSPNIGVNTSYDPFERAQRLLEAGVFDMKPLITHRHSFRDAGAAMELACRRPPGYIKGIFVFDETLA